MTRAQRFAPDLLALMAEQEAFWKGDPVSDRGRAQFHAMLAVVAAAGPVRTHPHTCTCHFCWRRRRRLANALAALEAARHPAPRRARRRS